jgi:hypothetical protein
MEKYILLLIVVVLLLVIFFIHRKDTPITLLSTRDQLDTLGICSFKNVLTPSQIEMLMQSCIDNDNKTVKDYIQQCPTILDAIHKTLGPDYVFQDYVFVIKKSSIHTCHRDGNSDMFNEKQTHPSYTMIVYLEDIEGGCLGIVPGSHDGRSLNLIGGLSSVVCRKGDMVLFNASLVHAGTLGPKSDNVRIQLKVTHRDDLEAINFYQQYNKVANRDNTLPFSIKKFHQQMSCLAPVVADMTQSEVQDTENVSASKKIFSKIVYGDSNFYDLNDAF